MASSPRGGEFRRENVYLPELALVTAPYPQAVKVGQFLFISGLLATDPETGRIVTRLEELGPNAVQIQTGHRQTDFTEEATKVQYWLTSRLLEQVIKSQGGRGLEDVLRINQFYRHGMKVLADIYPQREKLFKTPEEYPLLTFFGMRNLSVVEDAFIIGDAVALLPGRYCKEVDVVPERTVGLYPMWAKAGPFWFNSGEVAWDHVKHRAIRSFSDLPDAGRFLAQCRFHDVHTTALAQAWYIYQSLDKMLRDGGSMLSKVVRQNIYVRDVSDYIAIERVASILYKGNIPPTTLTPVNDLGPSKEVLMEIEVIALSTADMQT